MVITEVTSPAMTSAPPKVHSALLHHYEKSQRNRDIMPACVATSFARMNNNVYKHEYNREEILLSDTASSPDSEKSESSAKKDISKRFGNVYDTYEPTIENLVRPDQTTSPKSGPTNQNNNNFSSRSNSPKNINFENTTKQLSQPLKKRMLFGTNSPGDRTSPTEKKTTETPRMRTHQASSFSPSAFKPTGNAKRKMENKIKHNSSDILRQMYAAFGSTGASSDRLPTLPLGKSMENLTSGMCSINNNNNECNIAKQIANQNERKAKQSLQHTDKRKTHSTTSKDIRTKGQNVEMTQEELISSETPQSKKAKTLSNTNDSNAPQNGKRGFQIYKHPLNRSKMDRRHERYSIEGAASNKQNRIRHSSREALSPTTAKSVTYKRTLDSGNSETKRMRLNSSEQYSFEQISPDSPPGISQHPLAEMYKQGGLGFPYMNPLLFNPAALAAYGLPGAGMPFGVPGITQPNPLNTAHNPLLFGANPYFNNPLLLREMLSQGSLFPNPGLSQFPMHNGLSLEQLQALQHLNNPAFLHTSTMLGHGVLAPTAAALSAASLQSSFLHQTTNTSLLSPPTKPNNISGDRRKISKLTRVANSRDPSLESPPREQRRHHSGSCDSNSPVFYETRPDYTKHGSTKSTPQQDQKSGFTARSKGRGLPESAYTESFHQQASNNDQAKNHKRHHKITTKVEKRRQDRKIKDKSKPKPVVPPRPKLNEMVNFESVGRLDYDDEDREMSMLDTSGSGANPGSGNYKNLTRERRLVANARERTRVHTISSAFDELRAQIPSYSCNQKLSKLAILRIACSYIRTLSVMAGRDETITFPQGVDQCTKVLQSESRARSRRKSNKAQIEWEMVNYERHNRQNPDDNNNEVLDKDTQLHNANKNTQPLKSNQTVSYSTPEQEQSKIVTKLDEVEKCDEIDVESVEDDVDDVINKSNTSQAEQMSPQNSVDKTTSQSDVKATFHDNE